MTPLDLLFGAGPGSDLPLVPAVIFLDLNPPMFSGLDVLRRLPLDERTRLVPVVILTSSRQERDLFEGHRLGANSYARKSIDFGKSLEATPRLGPYWPMLNEAPPQPAR